LTKPLTILGELELVLYAETDCKDTDWFAQVTEVFPDGRSVAFHYGHGGARARYREGLTVEKLIPENTVNKFTISLGLAGHQMAVGNKLRLSIFSSNFPLFDPNTNTGNEVVSDVESKIASQTIFHDADHPSHIILPIIPSGSVAPAKA
jgi:putative CocE/NonD family hydrolase